MCKEKRMIEVNEAVVDLKAIKFIEKGKIDEKFTVDIGVGFDTGLSKGRVIRSYHDNGLDRDSEYDRLNNRLRELDLLE